MKNPAEETTVRPNQNQTMGELNQSNPVFQLVLYEKEPQPFPQPKPFQSRCDYSTKTGNKLSLFWQPFSKNCHDEFGRRRLRRFASKIWKLRTFQSAFWLTFSCMTLTEQMTRLARQAKAASRELAQLTTAEKNACLLAMATALEQNAAAPSSRPTRSTWMPPRNHGLSSAMLDRLKLDDKRIAGMARGLREVAALPDPVGRILDERVRPNGLQLQKISTPIGVVVIIYESRPNVTADAASLCFKSGNATILRGGKEAMHSNQIIARTMIDAGKIALAQLSRTRDSSGAHARPRGDSRFALAHAIR